MTAVTRIGTIVTEMSTIPERDLAAALFGKTRRAILAVLYGRPERALYLRELVRAASVGLGAAQREVKRLCGAGILRRSEQGRQVHYQANPDCPIFDELRTLIAKTVGLGDVVRGALTPLAGKIAAAFVYGSMASGEAGPESDVDLLVVGDVDEVELHRAVGEAEKALSRTVNYTLLSRDEFRRRRREKGGFLARVLRGPKIAILGDLDALR